MLAQGHPPVFAVLAIGALVVWRLYSRVRRIVGRQRLSPARAWLSSVVFPLLILLLLIGSLAHPYNAVAVVAGAALGIMLGVYGLRQTKFDVTPPDLFYTPSAHLGIALSALLIARIGWRFARLYSASGSLAVPPTYVMQSPLTLLIIGTLAGYYASYDIGLLRWRSRVAVEQVGPVK